ncbi:MAG TPA: hypothetical protein VK921_17595 [Anditalea sp.]|nr:hypothetical protein [Anditalea sp.]
MNKLLCLIIFLFTAVPFAQAQYSRDNVSVAIGPAMLYGDNAGRYRQFRFEISPALSLSYSREISDELDIRATAGVQLMDSGDFGMNSLRQENRSALENQAVHFTGQAFFLDVMPVYLFNPTPPGYVGYEFNYYADVGLGALYSNRVDQIPLVREESTDPIFFEEENNQSIAAYVPIRAGISTNLEGMWDIGVEGTLITALPSNVDGNTIKHKLLPMDMLLQFQVTLKRYLGR